MKFTVVALETVDAALATFFMESTERKSVSDAANWIEEQLKNDPLKKLTPVDDLYFLRRNPLVALCKVSVEDRLVTIVELNHVREP